MGHTTPEHLEHAEHSQHAAHDPFDRRVAMSMAIIAAGLAGVTLLSHRGHTEVVRVQAEANSIQTEAARLHTVANIRHTEETDTWGLYQAKNIRSHEFKAFLAMTAFLPKEPGTEKQREKSRKDWADQVDKYEGKPGKDGKRQGGDLAKLKAEAEGLHREAKEYNEKAEHKLEEAEKSEHVSHEVHHAINWIDSGHLGIEFALVLCSVAVLTKLRSFWFTGIVIALVGGSLASVGVYHWLMAPGANL